MSEENDARTKRVQELLDALNAPNLPAEKRARLERELDIIGRVLDPSSSDVPNEVPLMKPLFDIAAVHTRRAELDRKLFGRDDP